MKTMKPSDEDKVYLLYQVLYATEYQALYATEPFHKDAQEKYEASTALISQAILTSAAYILTVISNQVSLTSSFVNSFVLNSADHLSGISK